MRTARTRQPGDGQPVIIGWREKVSLPQLGVGAFSAKIDTGARLAALHATNIERDDHHVNFVLPLPKRRHRCRLPLKGMRRVKSSNGQTETRAVVETDVKIGKIMLRIDVTLTDRTDMGVAMLLGRGSIGHDFLVHPAKTNLLSAKKRKTP
ncbi:RimK/LysX family protein [Aestuariivirga sp.]|uniref:ATP-dependent zinc protease family protein n=1 Tax=Aestuariivirga sp. TaxID=2650926 RepID=UPI0025B7E3A9|nr:RimK/LysX family protein [Aestuariivirga sp.]MCA3556281.1 ATP-dependent zinc protease [Aestuariivirga sp.]